MAWGMAEEGSSGVCVRQQYRYSADGSLFHELFGVESSEETKKYSRHIVSPCPRAICRRCWHVWELGDESGVIV